VLKTRVAQPAMEVFSFNTLPAGPKNTGMIVRLSRSPGLCLILMIEIWHAGGLCGIWLAIGGTGMSNIDVVGQLSSSYGGFFV
jgi:hypothetical protein